MKQCYWLKEGGFGVPQWVVKGFLATLTALALCGPALQAQTAAGSAAILTGQNYIRTTKWSNALFTNEDFTFEFWFNASRPGVMLNEADTADTAIWDYSFIEIFDGGVVKAVVPGLPVINVGVVEFGTWHHIALTYSESADRLRGYLDGVLAASSSGDRLRPAEASRTAVYAFGRGGPTNLGGGATFAGMIDEVRIWRHEVASADIMARHRLSIIRPRAGLVASWQLDSVSGSSSPDTSGTENPAFHVPVAGPFALVPSSAGVLGGEQIVETLAHEAVNPSQVRLKARVNPGGFPMQFYFEYGPAPGFGSATTPAVLEIGFVDTTLSADLPALVPGQYQYRAVGNGTGGMVRGAIRTFTILPPAGNAVKLSGTDYFRTTTWSPDLFSSRSFTFECWVLPESAGVLVNEADTADVTKWDFAFLELLENGTLAVGASGITPFNAGPLGFGSWKHVAVSYDDTAKSLAAHINGQLVGNATGTWRRPEDAGRSAVYAFGRGGPKNLGPGGFFRGQFEEVRVWNRARTSQEIARDFRSIDLPAGAGLKGLWHFDTTNGNTSPDGSTNKNHSVYVPVQSATPLVPSTVPAGPPILDNSGGPRLAKADAQLVNGFVVDVRVLDAGSGYEATPSVRIVGGGGTGATAEATMANGVVTSIRVVSPGSGYTGPVTVQIDPPPFPPRKAVAIAEIVNGFIVGLTVLDGGNGYTEAPTVLVAGGGGNGATATAQLSNGVVTGFTITNPGSGYTGFPVVSIASPPFAPELSIAISRVKVTLKVVLGKRYVIEASQGLGEWVEAVAPFTAQAEVLEQEFMVDTVGRFFRVRQVP